MTTKNRKTTKTTKGTPEKPTQSTGEEQVESFIGAATSWCAERGVPTRVMPDHTLRLVETAGLLERAIEEAGGPEKVPEAVLLYRTLLHETALATALHGIKRSVLGLFSGAGR